MENLAKAIISVMKEVKGMEKNSRVGVGTAAAYDGTKDKDVKEVFNKAMSENGLCLLPIDVKEETQIDRWEENTSYGIKQKQSIFTKVKTKYLLLHESGESVELAGYGHGIDNQDKGAGKATTYAMKNCLLYTFCTPVGKIDDTDTTHSDSIEVPVKETKAEPTEWLNLYDKTGNKLPAFTALEKAIAEGHKYTLAGIRKKYKVSKEVQEQLKNDLNII